MIPNYLDILAKTINENWDRPALTDFYLTEDGTAQDTSCGSHYTYGEMYQEILRICEILKNLGLQKGDHIAICGANSAHWAIASLSITMAQGISVIIMNTLLPNQIVDLINFSDAKVLFIDQELWWKMSKQTFPQISNVISLQDWEIMYSQCGINDISAKEIESALIKRNITKGRCHFAHVEKDDIAVICFTSGSTGKPKGVMLPYRSIDLNVSYKFEEYNKNVLHRNILVTLPFAHAYSFMNEFIKPLCFGMNVNTIRSIINIHDFLVCYQLLTPAYMDLVPQVIEKLTMTKEIALLQNDGLISLFVGGAKMTLDLENELTQYDLPITTGYGITECGPIITATLPDKYRKSSVGMVIPTVQLSFSDSGEILVKGENVMLGYYKDPEATARKIDKDGWLHTGDKGHLDDDGYLYVEGRLEQDIIVLPNGENIRPDNIESLINALPEVKESIVLARDGKLVAIVVPQITNDQSQITNTDLRRIILRKVNPSLPLYSQLYDVEITDVPLQKTEKQTIKRYLYK